jgi:DNA-binding CsgD family transcriptional regulator
MMQTLTPVIEDNAVLHGMVLITDIAHIKTEGKCFMNIYNDNTGISTRFFCDNKNTVLPLAQTFFKLTRREKEIIRLLSAGYSSKQMASALRLSVKTVNNHRQHLLHKMNVGSSAELVAIAIKNSLI